MIEGEHPCLAKRSLRALVFWQVLPPSPLRAGTDVALLFLGGGHQNRIGMREDLPNHQGVSAPKASGAERGGDGTSFWYIIPEVCGSYLPGIARYSGESCHLQGLH